jgi:hypothetical protein
MMDENYKNESRKIIIEEEFSAFIDDTWCLLTS